MRFSKSIALLLFVVLFSQAKAQVVGGQFAMEFLRLANSPHISSLGGFNVANPENDIAFAFQNPSLMRAGMHNQLGLDYNNYYSGIKIMNLNYGYHLAKHNTSILFGVQYLDYGNFDLTDASGNQYGNFTAKDYAISIGASRQYQEHWRYGATLKWAHSMLYDNSASALLADVGISYYDSSKLLCIGAVAKNMGFMAKRYEYNQSAEPLPFDLQIGISKKFEHAPLRVMATFHHLYEWNVRYDNPADVQSSLLFGATDTTASTQSYFFDKLFRHAIVAAELNLSKHLAFNFSYNHLRRSELKLKDRPAMAGFAFGVDVNLPKYQVHFARCFYHVTGAYNEISFNFALNKLFDVGDGGDKLHWNADYGQ